MMINLLEPLAGIRPLVVPINLSSNSECVYFKEERIDCGYLERLANGFHRLQVNLFYTHLPWDNGSGVYFIKILKADHVTA